MNATDTPKAMPIAAPCEGTIATRVAAGLGLRPTLLDEWHFLRLAIVYVRQSDTQQILNHLESRERQYALVDLAVALGWPRDRILLIDEDQGITGKTAERRTGFHRLLSEVTMDHVGANFGIDMSRMARNNKDWHHLMEMCAIFGTVLADEDRGASRCQTLGLRGVMGLRGVWGFAVSDFVSSFQLVRRFPDV